MTWATESDDVEDSVSCVLFSSTTTSVTGVRSGSHPMFMLVSRSMLKVSILRWNGRGSVKYSFNA